MISKDQSSGGISGKRDIVSSLVWMAIAVFVFISSLRLGVGGVHNPGPGFVPFWASIFFVFFTILMFFMNILNKKEAAGLSDVWKGLQGGTVIIVIVSTIIYIFVIDTVGYLLATFGLMLALFGLGKMKPWVLVISAVLAVASSYYIFCTILKVPLPRGILGF